MTPFIQACVTAKCPTDIQNCTHCMQVQANPSCRVRTTPGPNCSHYIRSRLERPWNNPPRQQWIYMHTIYQGSIIHDRMEEKKDETHETTITFLICGSFVAALRAANVPRTVGMRISCSLSYSWDHIQYGWHGMNNVSTLDFFLAH